jgi:hypothetical protein
MVNKWSVFYLLLMPILVFSQKKDHRIQGNTEICRYQPTITERISKNKFKIMGATAGLCLVFPIFDSLPMSFIDRMGKGLNKMDRGVDKATNLAGLVIKANYRMVFLCGVPLYIGYKAGFMIDKIKSMEKL